MKARSLQPTKSTIFYNTLKHRYKIFNKNQRLDNQPELSFNQWCYNNNLDLSGKTLIKI